MSRRRVLERTTTPDGASMTLAYENGHYAINVDDVRLMSSEMYGSEQAMAVFAREELGPHEAPQILIGGLGMGFTVRAALDNFGPGAQIIVAELIPDIVRFNEGILGNVAKSPLDDPRVTVFVGDVRMLFRKSTMDVVLMDVDNGPDAFTTTSNGSLYDQKGVARMARCLKPGGVLVVWSAYPSRSFEERLAATGLTCRTEHIRGRWPLRKGPRHVLTIATRPK